MTIAARNSQCTDIWVLYPVQARYPGAAYKFRGANGKVCWPRADGATLGPVGVWNVLLRHGCVPRWVRLADVPHLPVNATLIAAVDGDPIEDVQRILGGWIERGGRVIGSGSWQGWSVLLSLESARWDSAGHPYAALGYVGETSVPVILAPPGWKFMRVDNMTSACRGSLRAIAGERQTPSRALVTELSGAPATVSHGTLTYLNGSPFSAFQSWLQGQEDLRPWLAWRHRLFWLDEHAAWLGRILAEHGLVITDTLETGLSPTTIVLRHDLDHSRDTSYLQMETAKGVPAVHAVLDDRNLRFWRSTLSGSSGHETAFHYDTSSGAFLQRGLLRALGRADPGRFPSRRAVTGDGLLAQLRKVQRAGIRPATLHRHMGYLIYPEWIDAMDKVLHAEPCVLGSSSLFRAAVLRWGVNRVDGVNGFIGEFPDIQFPYWFPFSLAHAGHGGCPLRGWETASVMEIEPAFFEQLLDHNVPGLARRVLTLNYHPAHANKPTFTPAGCREWFADILRIIEERHLDVMTLQEVYERMRHATEQLART